MDSAKIQKLEKSEAFRKKHYSKGIWKNYAIVPPSLIIFIALFGLLYLFNLDLLISLYTIPFVVLLLLGAIWLKSVRRYLLKQKVDSVSAFLICLSIPLFTKNGKTIRMFSVGKNRHSEAYLLREKDEVINNIEVGKYEKSVFTSGKRLLLVPETDIYIIIPRYADRVLNKRNDFIVNKYIIFDDSKAVKSIKLKDMA